MCTCKQQQYPFDSRHACQHPTTPCLQARCPSYHPTNSAKALKANVAYIEMQHIVMVMHTVWEW